MRCGVMCGAWSGLIDDDDDGVDDGGGFERIGWNDGGGERMCWE